MRSILKNHGTVLVRVGGVTLRQKRPQSPKLNFEDGVLHRRNPWPVGKTDDFSRTIRCRPPVERSSRQQKDGDE